MEGDKVMLSGCSTHRQGHPRWARCAGSGFTKLMCHHVHQQLFRCCACFGESFSPKLGTAIIKIPFYLIEKKHRN